MAYQQSHVTNPTRLVRIEKHRVSVVVAYKDNKRHSFDIYRLNLTDLGLPADANVWVVAAAGLTEKNFECGTIGNLTPIRGAPLDEIDPDKPLVFRVIVFNPGEPKLIATAEDIYPRNSQDKDSVLPLLPVEPVGDLGEQMWRVSKEEGVRPILQVNADPELNIMSELLVDPIFRALIIPEAVRQALIHMVRNNTADDSDLEAWQTRWKRFAADYSDVEIPSVDGSAPEVERWAGDVVASWATRARFKSSVIEQKVPVDG
jgi:hypothetical protein